MAIKDDAEFEKRLQQLTRFYRAQRKLWSTTKADDQAAVAAWVTASGKLLDALGETLGDLEDYTGCGELRIVLDQFKTIREQRLAEKEKA